MTKDWRAVIAWRSAVASVALNVIGMPVELAILSKLPDPPFWPALASMALGAGLLAVLIAAPRSRLLANTISLVNAAVIIAALFAIDRASGRLWAPFQEFKLGMVTAAALAPELWVGVAAIAAFAGATVIQLATFEDLRGRVPLGEPWSTVAFVGFAVILLAYRLKQASLERTVMLERMRLEATEQLAKVLLSVRDLANTPLQTIAVVAELARRRHADLAPLMDRVDRSLAKMRELDQQLRKHEDAVPWTRSEEGLDAPELARAAMTERAKRDAET